MLYVVLGTMLMYLIHLALPKILTYKNHRDFSPIQVRLANDSNIPDYVSRMYSATKNLQESLPIFFACAVLSIVMEVDSGAYTRDYLGDRKAYVMAMMKELNWKRIEDRFKRSEKAAKVAVE